MFGENVDVLDVSSFENVADIDADVVLNFYAPWCTFCTANHPVYRDLASSITEVLQRINALLLHGYFTVCRVFNGILKYRI